MKFIKRINIYEIYAASREECQIGYFGIACEYPCFCTFCKEENEKTTANNYRKSFKTIEEAKEWCKG